MKSRRCYFLGVILMINVVVLFTHCDKEDDKVVIRPSADEPYAVKQADHLAVSYDSMFKVDSMYRLFSETFELPIWLKPHIRKAANYNNEKFCNAAVYLGNFVLEFITYKIYVPGNPNHQIRSDYHFLAFTNYMEDNCPFLDSIGLDYQPPFSFVSSDGNGNTDTLFRNTFIYRGNYLNMFCCQYYPACYTYPNFAIEGYPDISDQEGLHQNLKNQLDDNNGGPLGIKSVEKIVIGTSDYQNDRVLFSTLFQPVSDNPAGNWKIKNGPAIELLSVPGVPGMKFYSIVINVSDLDNAMTYLDQKQVEYIVIGNSIKLTSISDNTGFDFYLKE